MTTLADAAPVLTSTQRVALIDELVLSTRRAQEALIRGASNALYAEWVTMSLAGSAEAFPIAYASAISGAQIEGHTLMMASIAEHASLAKGVTVAVPPVSATKGAWLATEKSYNASIAYVTRNRLLGEGKLFPDAVDIAGRVASGRGARDIQAAYRHAGEDWNRGVGPELRPQGWRKVLSGSSCGWCRVVADQQYKRAETVSAHDYDRCGFAPVYPEDGWSPGGLRRENDGVSPDYSEIKKEAATPDAATISETTDST